MVSSFKKVPYEGELFLMECFFYLEILCHFWVKSEEHSLLKKTEISF